MTWLFAQTKWAQPPGFADWMEEVAATRAQGFGIDHGQVNQGVLALAVPVELEGPVWRILSVVKFDMPADDQGIVRMADRLGDIAAKARSRSSHAPLSVSPVSIAATVETTSKMK